MFFNRRFNRRRQNMNCFSCLSELGNKCFTTQGSSDGRKRSRNCFSCFQSREGKTRKKKCFACFLAHDFTQGKTQTMKCFPCFQTQESTQGKQGKTRNMNCFSCFQAQYLKQKKKHKIRAKRLKIKLFPRKAKKDSTTGKTRRLKSLTCFPVQRKIKCKWLRRGKGKRRYRPLLPFKNTKRGLPEVTFQDVVFPFVKRNKNDARNHADNNVEARNFTFEELAIATKNFKEECLLGEGGFGRVYKGTLEKTGEIVAVKQLNREGKQGNGEFLVEVMMLSHLSHPHLVKLVGYCSDGDQRLLVYEYMPSGSLENHLLDLLPGKPSLDWSTRIKVALQAAQGLEYLHESNKPAIIYRDLKSSNILLDKDFNAKLSDFGLARIGPVGDKTHVTSRVMGTLGYCAPEYQKTGRLTVKSDIYSYGVVLLELITGKRAVDLTRKSEELHLVRWAETRIKDPKKYSELVDPLLEGNYPQASLSQVLAIAAMCLSTDASVRPSISDVVAALASLAHDQIPSK